MIEVAHLTRRFGRTMAVDNLSFTVRRGEIVGFLGPNGAGKTTTMRILAGFLPATGGSVSIAGYDVLEDSLEVRRRTGYLPESFPLYAEMRVVEYLRYRGRLKGLRRKRLKSRLDDVIADCGLANVRRKIIGRLSKGYRQRVALADSLIHEPDLLLLDEPTLGMDPNQRRHIRDLVRSLAKQHTVLLSSHLLREVERICDRVLIMNDGRIVASDTPANLVGLMKGNPRIVAEVRGPRHEIYETLKTLKGVLRASWEASEAWTRFSLECEKGTDVRADLYRAVAAHQWVLRELRMERSDLEDVFVAVTAEALKG